MQEPGWDWAIRDGEGLGCPRCGAVGTQRTRRRLTREPLRWLRSGGPLFPHGVGCSACGYRWPGRLGVIWGGPPAPRWQLPWHVVRAAVVALQQQRTAQPVPWLYLACAGLGAGAGGALATRRGHPGRGAALGAVTGLATCWSAFAWTAVRQYGTATAIADAVLILVSGPEQNIARHARRQEEQAAGAGFVPYGLDSSWQGQRFLVGSATSWGRGRTPPRVTELLLGHTTSTAAPGAPGWDEGVQVATLAPRGDGSDHRWHLTTDELLDHLGWELQRRGSAAGPARRGTAVVVLDGSAVEAASLHGDGRWVVVVRTADTHVEVRGTGEPPRELQLAAVRDLSAYPSL